MGYQTLDAHDRRQRWNEKTPQQGWENDKRKRSEARASTYEIIAISHKLEATAFRVHGHLEMERQAYLPQLISASGSCSHIAHI